MNNPLMDIWGKWEIQNMDDKHYYQMGNWSDQPKPGLFKRILEAISRELIILGCRLEELNKSPYFALDQRCGCAEG